MILSSLCKCLNLGKYVQDPFLLRHAWEVKIFEGVGYSFGKEELSGFKEWLLSTGILVPVVLREGLTSAVRPSERGSSCGNFGFQASSRSMKAQGRGRHHQRGASSRMSECGEKLMCLWCQERTTWRALLLFL